MTYNDEELIQITESLKQEWLDKACEWLKDCLDNGAWISHDVGQYEKNAIIEHFKTYMEE